jgi:hypothetical protein
MNVLGVAARKTSKRHRTISLSLQKPRRTISRDEPAKRVLSVGQDRAGECPSV